MAIEPPRLKLAYLYSPEAVLHEMGPGHPEQPERVRAIDRALADRGLLDRMLRLTPEPAPESALLRVHGESYLRSLAASAPESGGYCWLDGDTAMNRHSWRAAQLAAGAGLMAVDAVMVGDAQRAFCNVRPPGHHAERHRAMGFCLINNIAVAAAQALEVHGLKRVAIVDFDVHHGNGTEDIFTDEPRVLLCSTFQSPLYPYCGEDTRSNHIVNVPLPAGTDGAAYRKVFATRVVPVLESFRPELVLFSAGFDAHRDDPLAGMNLVEDDYHWVTRAVLEVTRESSQARAVSFLEGGYALDALAASVCRHVEALLTD
ncbi:MAG: histone deacetylase family protein [Methylococcus sp.]